MPSVLSFSSIYISLSLSCIHTMPNVYMTNTHALTRINVVPALKSARKISMMRMVIIEICVECFLVHGRLCAIVCMRAHGFGLIFSVCICLCVRRVPRAVHQIARFN
jgi:uncharacterized protein with PQ loop repeat